MIEIRQWSDHLFACYVDVTEKAFSGRFIGTAPTREAAQRLARQGIHGESAPEWEHLVDKMEKPGGDYGTARRPNPTRPDQAQMNTRTKGRQLSSRTGRV